MQTIVRKDKQSGEMTVEYFRVSDKYTFRFELLRRILQNETDITIILDTNSQAQKRSDAQIEETLARLNLQYITKPLEANPTAFFGVFIRSKTKKIYKKLIVLSVSPEQFTRELFDSLLSGFDIAIGLGKQRPIEEIAEYLKLDVDEVLFHRTYFRQSVYDSIICTCLRSSFDIGDHLSEMENLHE